MTTTHTHHPGHSELERAVQAELTTDVPCPYISSGLRRAGGGWLMTDREIVDNEGEVVQQQARNDWLSDELARTLACANDSNRTIGELADCSGRRTPRS